MKIEQIIEVMERHKPAKKDEQPVPFKWSLTDINFRDYGKLVDVIPAGLVCRARNQCGRIAEWTCPEPILIFSGRMGPQGNSNWALTIRDGQLASVRHPHVFPSNGEICMGSAHDVLTALMSLNPGSPAGLRLEYEYNIGGPTTPCVACEHCGHCAAHEKRHVADPHLHHTKHLTDKTCGKCITCKECTCVICECRYCGLTAPCAVCKLCDECKVCAYHIAGHKSTCSKRHETCGFETCEVEGCDQCGCSCPHNPWASDEDEDDDDHRHCDACDRCENDGWDICPDCNMCVSDHCTC